jgi:hypothetical protein
MAGALCFPTRTYFQKSRTAEGIAMKKKTTQPLIIDDERVAESDIQRVLRGQGYESEIFVETAGDRDVEHTPRAELQERLRVVGVGADHQGRAGGGEQDAAAGISNRFDFRPELAARLRVAVSIILAIALELVVGYMIRDNLTLNIIMLIWPLEAVRTWQAGG